MISINLARMKMSPSEWFLRNAVATATTTSRNNSSFRPVAKLGYLSLSLFLILSGCHSRDREAWPENSESQPETAAVMVTVEPVVRRSVRRTVEAVGTLHGYEEVTISTKIEGTVRSIQHDVADRVSPNEVLLEIDPTNYELAVRQAEQSLQVELAKLGLTEPPGPAFDVSRVPPVLQALAKLENANVKLERTRALRQKNVNTSEELADRVVDSRVAQAEHDNQVLIAKSGVATIRVKQEDLSVAQQQLRDTIIRVPTPTKALPDLETAGKGITYAITKRTVSEGTLVRSGTEVFRLVLDRTLKLKTAIPERHGSEIELGQTAEIFIAAYPKPFSGKVTRINPAVDSDTRTFEVEVQVANPKSELKAGSFAKVAIITRTDSSATTVPLESLVSFAGITKIFLLENGHAREVQIIPGTQSTDWVEIQSPELPQSAQVVTSGHSGLSDGVPISIRTVEQPAAEPTAN
ncbi:MAG: efflux transporter periplasmic adaptor subunit [Planctomycetaceae bacterium]|nr:efflux transporter periplasmic adaptor subunit [Planctomycetaceae bacterium]